VVALVNPNLMPVQPGSGKTSITFSVYGASQLLMVARAMDYGTCKATVRVKDSDGKWTPSGKCKNFIDKRKCDFCDVHRKQQQQKNSNGSNGSLQKLRDQQLGFVPNQQGNPASNNRFLNPGGTAKAPIGQGRCVPLQMQKTLPANSQSRQNETTSSNRLLNGARTTNPGITSRQKECTSSNRLLNTMRTTNRGAANITTGNAGTAKAARVTPATQTRPKRKTGFVGTAPLRGNGNVDWFQEASAPVASNSRGTSFLNAAKKKKRRTINVGGGGFDGSVQVPKQSRLFQSKAPNTISKATPSGPSPQQAAEARHKILQNQAVVATLLKQSSTNPYSNKNGKTAASTATKKTVSGSFYDGLGDVNLEKANNTKSRFATEVEAEEYAKSRQKVVALEKLETSKEKKKKAGKENRFMTHYVCQTCGNRSAQNPKSCVAAGHQVVKSRSLTESESKTEKRTSLHQKSATDGGLRLGAGNEWSRNLKDFHS
jgi:ribosomal protein L37E